MAARRLLERGAVSVPIGLLLGLLTGLLEGAWRAHLPLAPDLLAVALGALFLRAPDARCGGLVLGVLLGFSTFSADPIGTLLLGGGMAALVLVPLREVVFVDSVLTHALFGGLAALLLRCGRELFAWFDLAPALPFSTASWSAPLLAALLLPILARLGEGGWNAGRRLAAAVASWRSRAGRHSA